MRLLKLLVFSLATILTVSSCGKKERSATTGWAYNDQKWGGFEKVTDYEGQVTGPNLVPIEGGTFTMGQTGEDVTMDWNNVPRRVTVSSFYMDETEVSNVDYREYLFWLKKTFGESYPEVFLNALPDTVVWREELAYNEPMMETYFRHPSFDSYPVVGVSWHQASKYAEWRTDRVNEMILIERGFLNPNLEQADEANFDTEAYLAGVTQDGAVNRRKGKKDFKTGGERDVRFEDGILLPKYRLPTEAEWEYAALGLQGNMASEQDERISDRRLYPWDGNTLRYQKRNKYQGRMLANFKRGYGDYMGMAGNLNDNAAGPAEVRSFIPNDFGLYHMAGNVNEWVADIYRPMTSVTLSDAENHDLNPYRGGRYQERVLDEEGKPELDSLGSLRYQDIDESTLSERENIKTADVFNYLDGDERSSAFYDTGRHTLVSDNARVFKGGSWADRPYWLQPGTRRFKEEDRADRNIGFRCAMTRVGAPGGNDGSSGNKFKVKGKKKSKRRY